MPYIYEDRISEEDFINALETMYKMKKEDREQMAKMGREHVDKNYSFEKYQENWVEIFDKTYEKHGSWQDRKSYSPWVLKKIN